MARRTAIVIAAMTLALGGGLAAPPAQAVQSLTYVFVVPCADEDGVLSDEGPGEVTLPDGVYAVAYAGVCAHGTNESTVISVSTPCSLPEVGAVPCVGTTVNNYPPTLCRISTGTVEVTPCDPMLVSVNSCPLTVLVNEQCLNGQHAGLIDHQGGAMKAQFSDSYYGDNAGYFIVTATWTPLPHGSL